MPGYYPALENNFTGNDLVRHTLLKAPKSGNDDDDANHL